MRLVVLILFIIITLFWVYPKNIAISSKLNRRLNRFRRGWFNKINIYEKI